MTRIMSPVSLRCVFLLLLLNVVEQVFGDDEEENPDNIVILPLSAYKCEDVDNIIGLDVDLHDINDDGDKLLSAEIELDERFTEQWQFTLKIDKWNNGDWDENFYLADGAVCQIAEQYVSKAWKKFREATSPEMTGSCAVEEGHYSLEDLDIFREDYDIPVNLLGRYRVTGKLFDPENTEMACQIIELVTDKK